MSTEDDANPTSLCPHCFNEMSIGYISSTSAIFWFNQDQLAQSFRMLNGKKLARKSIMSGTSQLLGYRCESCKITIVEDPS